MVRPAGGTSGDVALAVMFYGGIAVGVVLMARAPGGRAMNLNAYLFGAITTTGPSTLSSSAALATLVLVVTLGLRPGCSRWRNDEEYARAAGLPVLALNLLLAVLTAVTVVVSMRVVGAAADQRPHDRPERGRPATRRAASARACAWPSASGLACSVGGVAASYYLNTPSGGTIVVAAVATSPWSRSRAGLVKRLRRRRSGTAPSPRTRARTRTAATRRSRTATTSTTCTTGTCTPPTTGTTTSTGRTTTTTTTRRHTTRRHTTRRAPPATVTRGVAMAEVERRATRQRRVIEDALRGTPEFVSAQTLHGRLRDAGETIGLATVYRALGCLVADGAADMIRRDDGEAMYRLCATTHHHHHLVCRDCGTAVEIEAPEDEEWARDLAQQHGFRDVWHTLEIFGTCGSCADQNAEPRAARP